MTVSTPTVVPEASASGTAPAVEPTLSVPPWWYRSVDLDHQAAARILGRGDYPAWLDHVRPVAGCTRPIRLAGTLTTIDAATGVILSATSTESLPDGVVYKRCGNRRASVCPTCSDLYKRDAYQLVRVGLVGGKGVPEHVARHPAVFPTLTAPSFGPVHTRHIRRHTCTERRRCDCRPDPCHPRRDNPHCPHGRPLVCWARHDDTDTALGTPLCLDCYDHQQHVVWNVSAGELWRRTTIAIRRHLEARSRHLGIAWIARPAADGTVRHLPPFRLSFGKAAEMQRRAAVHFHAIIRLDGVDPTDPDAVVPPPAGLDAADLVAAVDHAAATVAFTTKPHPANPAGWRITWGDQTLTKVITVAADGDVTDAQVAAYLAKYATKATEVTGHACNRLTADTIDLYADPDGTHIERLIDACWTLGTPTGPPTSLTGHPRESRPAPGFRTRWTCPTCHTSTRYAACPTCTAVDLEHADPQPAEPNHPTGKPDPYRRLRRWAHMLGFGGHFLTKSRRYSITFTLLRDNRITWRRTTTPTPGADTGGPVVVKSN